MIVVIVFNFSFVVIHSLWFLNYCVALTQCRHVDYSVFNYFDGFVQNEKNLPIVHRKK